MNSSQQPVQVPSDHVFTITLRAAHIQVIDRALQELPFKDAAPVLHAINEELQREHTQAARGRETQTTEGERGWAEKQLAALHEEENGLPEPPDLPLPSGEESGSIAPGT